MAIYNIPDFGNIGQTGKVYHSINEILWQDSIDRTNFFPFNEILDDYDVLDSRDKVFEIYTLASKIEIVDPIYENRVDRFCYDYYDGEPDYYWIFMLRNGFENFTDLKANIKVYVPLKSAIDTWLAKIRFKDRFKRNQK